MSIEVRPLGVRCNLACTYCYQHPMRDAGNFGPPYDMEAMLKALEAEGGPFTVFGGEPLLVPKEDLERLWAFGLERYGQNGVQTNGALIDDDHIALFKKYRVHVGFSIDGPGELNRLRWAGSVEATDEATERSIRNLRRLLREGVPASLIITVHQVNAGDEAKRARLADWLVELHREGLRSIRLHALEVDNPLARRYALPPEEAAEAFIYLWERIRLEAPGLQVDVFHDIFAGLRGDDSRITCIWHACDPWTTRAVRGVDGDGRRSNCGRTNKEGIDWIKAQTPGYERYIALYQTPQEYGGCQGCRFFALCKGNCPGTSLDGDFRNRSEQCEFWYALMEYAEKRLEEVGITPISRHPKREALEAYLLRGWMEGRNPSIAEALRAVEGGPTWTLPVGSPEHGDYTDHGDAPHGDHWDG